MSPQAHLESGHEAFFLARVRAAGGVLVKLIPVSRGMPDRLVLWPNGRAYLVELKTVDGKTSPIQDHVHAKLAAGGHPVHVLWGRDQILGWLRERAAEEDGPSKPPRGRTARRACPGCGREIAVNQDGRLRAHHCERNRTP